MGNTMIEMAEFLEWLADTDEYPEELVGVCSNLYHGGFSLFEVCQFLSIAERWDKFSGDRQYPVPDSCMDSAEAAYDNCVDNMWDKDTQYGRDRRELCRFVAGELRKEVGK